MSELAKELFANLIECMIQNRSNVSKKQMARFNEVNKEIRKHREKAYGGQLRDFFASLLLKNEYSLKPLITLTNEFQSAVIAFRLKNRFSQEIVDAQIWIVQLQQFGDLEKENKEEQFKIIAFLFQELLMFLNQQPLFSLYQRESALKKNYEIVHEVRIGSKQMQGNYNVIKMKQKYIIQRSSHSFSINIFCYLCPNFDKIIEEHSKKLEMDSKAEENLQTNTSSKNDKIKKPSVYEFYDDDLDFIFLSSDDENLDFHNNKSTEVDISKYIQEEEDEDEFEMLIMNKDEEFTQDNRNIFMEMVSLEKDCLYL